MTCNVVLTRENGRFLAHVAELPDCKAEAESRDKALALIQKRLEEIVERSDVVQLEIPNLEKILGKLERFEKRSGPSQPKPKTAKQSNIVQLDPFILADDKTVHLETPWEYAGIFKDDPTWWPMIEEIERRRDRQVVYPKKKKRKR